MSEHADYPHFPGQLHDCPMCEAQCFCDTGDDCVFCAQLTDPAEDCE